MVLCMTVNPGWGGQRFLEHSLTKLVRLRDLIGPDRALEVDGGIDAETAAQCAAAGATVFVAGTAVFGAQDPAGSGPGHLDRRNPVESRAACCTASRM